MLFLSWLLWSVKCHCCCFFCFFSSPSWNYRSENRNYRNKQPPLQSNHLKTCKIYKYSSANANFSKSSHKGHKTKGQILKYSNDSLWTKPSKILAFTAMFRIYCIPRTLIWPPGGLNLSMWDLFTIGDTGSRTPVILGIDKTFDLTNLEDFHKAQAEIHQMKPLYFNV